MFDFIEYVYLQWALKEAYDYCQYHGYLKFFEHPEIHLYKDKLCNDRMYIDDQNHVIVFMMPGPSRMKDETNDQYEKRLKKWLIWLKKIDEDDHGYEITLQDIMDCVIDRFDNIYKEEYGKPFHTYVTKAWIYDNLRQISIHGHEKYEKVCQDWWNMEKYRNFSAEKNNYVYYNGPVFRSIKL